MLNEDLHEREKPLKTAQEVAGDAQEIQDLGKRCQDVRKGMERYVAKVNLRFHSQKSKFYGNYVPFITNN